MPHVPSVAPHGAAASKRTAAHRLTLVRGLMNLRAPLRGLLLLAFLGLGQPGHAQAQSGGDAAPVNGVLVKFRDAPAHALLRKSALAASSAASVGASAHELRVRQALAESGLASARVRPLGRDALHLQFDAPLRADEALRHAQRLRERADVEWAEPNTRERRLQTVSDPLFPADPGSTGQWWLFPVQGSNSNALVGRMRGVPGVQSAWGIVNALPTGAPVVVAVLDTGITAHPDLDANVLPGYDFVSTVEYAGDGDGRDADAHDPGDFVSAADKTGPNAAAFSNCVEENSSWHGTNIAGVVAAVTNNATGVAAVNGNARILPVRVAGKCGAELADIIDAMHWAAGEQLFNGNGQPLPLNPNPARVVNISFGGTTACSAAYQSAIDALALRGAVVVAAAGNEHGAVTRPANCERVIGVAAVNRDGFKSTYSNFGAKLVIATVGGDPFDPFDGGRWGALLGDDGLLTIDNLGVHAPDTQSVTYSRISGTSFAAPVVAGVISLMLAVNPQLTVAQVINGVRASARPHVVSAAIGACSAQNPGRCVCSITTCGAGLLDAEQAILYAQAPLTYVAPARQAANVDSADVLAAAGIGADRDANPVGASGGGGAVGPAGLLVLGLALVLLRRGRR